MSQTRDSAELERTLRHFNTFEEAEQADLEENWAMSPLERLALVETLRQKLFGYDPLTNRLPRPLTFAERREG